MTKLLLLFFLLARAISPALAQAQQRNTDSEPLTDATLRQAVELWMGTDHNRAEITGLIGHISHWDTSQVSNFDNLFKGQSAFDEDLSAWNTSSVTSMKDVFNGCTSFRGRPSLEQWDTSRVTSMARMFKSATSWVGDLSNFDTSSVTDTSYMFQQATLFQGEGLETWDVSNVFTFNFMFNRATNFNADIGGWNTESAEFMEGMFEFAVSFDQNISGWNVDNVVSVGNMFEGAASYDQALCWPGLQEEAFVDGLFCGSHPAARFDPCCVNNTLIENACCGGNCDTFCRPPMEETRPPYSNDPPAEDETDVDEDIPSDGSGEVDTQPPNATPQAEDEQSDGVDAFEEDESEQGTASTKEEEESLWQRYVWLRIIVYIAALIVLAALFYAFLRSRSQPDTSHTGGPNSGAAGAEDHKDTEIGIVTTNLTDLTDGGDDKKDVGVEAEKKAEEKDEKMTAPPESPKK